jgi:hypothetical protein
MGVHCILDPHQPVSQVRAAVYDACGNDTSSTSRCRTLHLHLHLHLYVPRTHSIRVLTCASLKNPKQPSAASFTYALWLNPLRHETGTCRYLDPFPVLALLPAHMPVCSLCVCCAPLL